MLSNLFNSEAAALVASLFLPKAICICLKISREEAYSLFISWDVFFVSLSSSLRVF